MAGFKDLTPEQMERARACKTVEDLVALTESQGMELSDEQLEVVTGGCDVPDELVNRVPGKYVIKGVIAK